jgi:uncharacterized protein (UPF0333 family)
MRAQLTMEFIISFLIIIIVLSYLTSGQMRKADELGIQIKQIGAKNAVEKIASQCNLVYFNWKRAEFGFSFNLSNLQIVNNTFVLEESGKNITSRCLSDVSGVGEIVVTGVRRWF